MFQFKADTNWREFLSGQQSSTRKQGDKESAHRSTLKHRFIQNITMVRLWLPTDFFPIEKGGPLARGC